MKSHQVQSTVSKPNHVLIVLENPSVQEKWTEPPPWTELHKVKSLKISSFPLGWRWSRILSWQLAKLLRTVLWLIKPRPPLHQDFRTKMEGKLSELR